jgi:hypothetical protein
MGHSSIQVTYDKYGHLMPGNEDQAAELLDAYLTRTRRGRRVTGWHVHWHAGRTRRFGQRSRADVLHLGAAKKALCRSPPSSRETRHISTWRSGRAGGPAGQAAGLSSPPGPQGPHRGPCLAFRRARAFPSATRAGSKETARLLVGGGQRLVSRPVLNAPLELVHGRRCCPPGMTNDPYDLPNASALTAIGRRPAGGGQTLAVSTAALADPVCDSWHRRQIRLFPETVDPSTGTKWTRGRVAPEPWVA